MSAVSLSAPEVQSLAFKATRGAGFAWGIAEEAAQAVAWLHGYGLDGTAALGDLLGEPRGATPNIAAGRWSAPTPQTPLCPLVTGVALCDFLSLPEGLGSGALHLSPLRHPLLLPFVARCAETLRRAVQVQIGESATIVVGAGQLSGPILVPVLAPVALRLLDQPAIVAKLTSPVPVQPSVLAMLEGLALRTTVPATAASRASGAGASGSDND